jgi:Leucine-rich repeat (LRR) protein
MSHHRLTRRDLKPVHVWLPCAASFQPGLTTARTPERARGITETVLDVFMETIDPASTSFDAQFRRFSAQASRTVYYRLPSNFSVCDFDMRLYVLDICRVPSLTKLTLVNCQLEALPPAVGLLTALKTLDVSMNALTHLPTAVRRLTALDTLLLSRNHLVAIDDDAVAPLTELRTLNVDHNLLVALPDAVGRLHQLSTLNVSRNRLTALPDAIGNCTQLTQLFAGANRLTTLPDLFDRLTELRELNVQANYLTRLPDSIGSLARLEELDISYNRGITALPESIGGLNALATLSMSGVGIRTFPESFARLPNLKVVHYDTSALEHT